MPHHSQHWTRSIAASLCLAAAVAACKSDSTNTAPEIAASLTMDVTTTGQTAVVGGAIPLPMVVHVFDASGNPVAGATVNWAVVNGAGILGASTSTTDATGMSNMVWNLDTIARVDSATASISAGASVTFFATGTAGPATNTMKVSGDSQTVTSDSTSKPFVIKVVDRYGNAVSGVAVTWAVTGGGALAASTSTTDVNGMASVVLTLGATPGPYVITATAGALVAVTFSLTGT
jgi:adhesin/invasin